MAETDAQRMERIRFEVDECICETDDEDVVWLLAQVVQAQRLRAALEGIMQLSHCDCVDCRPIVDFARHALEQKE